MPALVVGIDSDHVDLAELAFVKADDDEAGDVAAFDSNPGLHVRIGASVPNRLLLTHAPAVGIELLPDIGCQCCLQGVEYWRPRAQREAHDCLEVA